MKHVKRISRRQDNTGAWVKCPDPTCADMVRWDRLAKHALTHHIKPQALVVNPAGPFIPNSEPKIDCPVCSRTFLRTHIWNHIVSSPRHTAIPVDFVRRYGTLPGGPTRDSKVVPSKTGSSHYQYERLYVAPDPMATARTVRGRGIQGGLCNGK